MELLVLLVNRILIISFIIMGLPKFCVSQSVQSKTWGVSLIPGFSKAKDVGSVTFDPNTFIDLKIIEPWQFVPQGEIFLANNKRLFSYTKAIGVEAYNYYDRWEYDPATTTTNYVWGKRSFIFVYAAYKLGHEFPVRKMLILPEAGLSVDYMVRGRFDSESKVGSIHQSILSQLPRTNFGFMLSFKIKTKLNKKFDFQAGAYYKKLIKDYPMPFNKNLYFIGLSLDLIWAKRK